MQVLRLLMLIILMSSANVLRAQPDSVLARRSNTVYLEAGGIGGLYSFNYQRNFRLSEKGALAAGIMVAPVWFPGRVVGGSNFSPRAGVQAQYIFRKGRSEFGAGAASMWYTWYDPKEQAGEGRFEKALSVHFLQLGYSYITRKNLYLGTYLTPAILQDGDWDPMPWGGLRIGYRF